MSDRGAPGSGPPPPGRSRRQEAADSLRSLGHALVGHEASDDIREKIAEQARWATDALGAGPRRAGAVDALITELTSPPPSGAPIEHYRDCPVSGVESPFSVSMSAVRDGDGAVVEVVLGRAHEGSPGRAHGGVVAAVFDDAFGFLAAIGGEPCFAGELTVRFLRPVPLGRALLIRCTLERVEGRRRHAIATMGMNGETIAEASVVLVVVALDRAHRWR